MSRHLDVLFLRNLLLSEHSRQAFGAQLTSASGSDDIAACMRVSKAIEHALGSMSQTPKTQEQHLQVSAPVPDPPCPLSLLLFHWSHALPAVLQQLRLMDNIIMVFRIWYRWLSYHACFVDNMLPESLIRSHLPFLQQQPVLPL